MSVNCAICYFAFQLLYSPKEKQNVYMRITLSINELQIEGATYQAPLMRRLSKSAKARARKRRKGAE